VIPDLDFVRKHIPITDVAARLGLSVFGRAAHCWRTEAHQNADRTPSLSFNRTRNIARCFVCDDHALTPIDLVAAFHGSTLGEAVAWIQNRFDVPALAKNRKLARPGRWHIARVGVASFPLEALIRSGLWATMSDAERAILPTLCAFADPSSGDAKISYRGLARFSGKSSDRTIAQTLHRFERIALLKVHRSRSADGLRACGSYTLDFDNAHFQSLLSKTHQHQTQASNLEKALRQHKRTLRTVHKSKPLFTVVKNKPTPRFTVVKCGLASEPREVGNA